ncbi:MAG: tyrosine-type recombinase/integrase [Limisphaerales bacterium]
MASLVKRNGSPYWFIQYRQGNRWNKRSTRLKHSVSVDTRKAREECAHQTLKELAAGRVNDESRWECWVPKFFEQRYDVRLATKARYQTTWRTWLIYLSKLGLERPTQVNYRHCLDFIPWRQDPKTKGVYACSRNTAIYDLKAFGTIMQEAVRRGFIGINPARGLGLVKDRPAEKPEITAQEEALIRRALPDWPEWMSVAFDIAMATGCRLRETQIELRNIDENHGTVSFVQKGDRPHTTALPPKLIPLIRRLRAEGRTRTVDLPERPSKEWWRFFRSVGLPHIQFHCTRVTVVTRLARAGVPERHTMRFVGHSSSTVHRVYTKLGVDDLIMCVRVLDGESSTALIAR